MSFSPSELCDLILIYGEVGQDVEEAQREYKERFPSRQCPSEEVITKTLRSLREQGTLMLDDEDSGGETERTENSHNKEKLQTSLLPCYTQEVPLTENDCNARLRLCAWLHEKLSEEPNFSYNVLFTGECCFTNNGILNYHNPYCESTTQRKSFQYDFSVNVWAGIIGNTLLGPFVFPTELNGETYLQFLQGTMPGYLEDVPLKIRKHMWFMHDGVPLHISQSVRNFFHDTYSQWIGRGGHVQWPIHSPDLNPLHYFLWTYIKNQVYCGREIEDKDDLQKRILVAAADIRQATASFQRMHESLPRRVDACGRANGARFHYFL
ncbi:hypothetical protein Trydic_g4090 [Trypoxylus dichotomus]